AEPSDLQSDPFGHSGIPPQVRGEYYQTRPCCKVFSLKYGAFAGFFNAMMKRRANWSKFFPIS
ncbi:hypothetical protein, partial [Enterovibrio norvegicus]